MRSSPFIEVFVSSNCPFAFVTHRILEELRRMRPDIEITVIDVESTLKKLPNGVFSTPTWMCGGKIVSVGNPDPVSFFQSIGAHQT